MNEELQKYQELAKTYLAKKGVKTSELRKTYPEYIITKNRIDLTPGMDVDALLKKVAKVAVKKKHSGLVIQACLWEKKPVCLCLPLKK